MKHEYTADELAILDAIENGRTTSTPTLDEEKRRYGMAAAATLRKDKRVNIRISERDLSALQRKALEEGIPYQTLIASLLHRYINGRLVDSR